MILICDQESGQAMYETLILKDLSGMLTVDRTTRVSPQGGSSGSAAKSMT